MMTPIKCPICTKGELLQEYVLGFPTTLLICEQCGTQYELTIVNIKETDA